jgi:hypothetical protein
LRTELNLPLRLQFGVTSIHHNAKALHEESQRQKYTFIDIDDTPNRTPDLESEFVRELLAKFGAVVLNAFNDDKSAFSRELIHRCGENARVFEVTDDSDFVNFFPSLASDIIGRALNPSDADANGAFAKACSQAF